MEQADYTPRLDHQTATADFINNRLPEYHPAFENPSLRLNRMYEEHGLGSQASTSLVEHGAVVHGSNASTNAFHANDVLPRPNWTKPNVMMFWNDILLEAMNTFQLVPELKGRAKTDYDIRGETDWNMIYGKLEGARAAYQNKGGWLGILQKARRKVADNITPVAEVATVASKAVPNNPYSTPILGCVEFILNVRLPCFSELLSR